ncbi:hypothetical protein [Rhizobium sp. R693]|uniref:hypothetical protein n=1 Tax=Rhizobium sp. R693 TaxID=1764276 RepID=UPI001675B9E7|nr:hypothetical protein [Rhizobium sp. R693]
MHAQDGYKWLRWLVLGHALLLVLMVMIATVFSVLLYRANSDVTRSDFRLQRSIEDRL